MTATAKRALPVVAIDGPAGSGKSTAAKLSARKLGFDYLDTGAMYRTATLISMLTGISPEEPEKLTAEVKTHKMFFHYENGVSQVVLDGKDVSQDIRCPELTRLISPVCEIPAIREYLGKLQREMGRDGGVVLEGRDIGTVIFPDAEVKVFLTASAEVRSRRRWLELKDKSVERDFAEVLADLKMRDQRDADRKIAPLIFADDAVIIDSSEMDSDQVAGEIVKLVNEVRGVN